MNDALRHVLKKLHYPLEIMLICVRWYVAYPLSLRHMEEMMHERGVFVDHTTIPRWTMKVLPVLAAVLRRRKRPVGNSWRMDETYVRVHGEWKYLYRAMDKEGHTVDFLLTARRDLAAARRFLERAIGRHGLPDKITIDKSGANTVAVQAIQDDTGAPIELRQVTYLLELGSFVRAANETGLTQPAVSKAIYELEEFFGEALFLRNNRGVQPTDFGILLGRRAKSLIAELRYMTEEINAFRTGEAGHVIVGTLISAAAELLPSAISLLMKSFPNIQITIREGTPPHLFPALVVGDIDLVVGRLPGNGHEFSKALPVQHEVLYKESFCLVVGLHNPLAQCDHLKLSHLLASQWIFPPAESPSRKAAEAMFNSAGLPVPAYRVESLSLLCNLGLLVETNMVAFMPHAVASQFVKHGLVSVLNLPSASEFGDVGFSIRADKESTPACTHFMQCLRQAVTQSDT